MEINIKEEDTIIINEWIIENHRLRESLLHKLVKNNYKSVVLVSIMEFGLEDTVRGIVEELLTNFVEKEDYHKYGEYLKYCINQKIDKIVNEEKYK